MNIRVVVADDHRMLREALTSTLGKESDLAVVGEAGTAATTLELMTRLDPDVLVLDIGLPDFNGMEVATRLRASGSRAKIVALSAYADKRFVTEMLRAGASAYVTKLAAGAELVRAIRAVMAGHSYLSPEIAGALISEVRDPTQLRKTPRIARREREVLRLIAAGTRTPQIALKLHISVSTVEVHRRNIMRKLGLHTVADLTKHAIREGIVSL